MRGERLHKQRHEEHAGLMYCRHPLTLRNVKANLTVVETNYFQLCVDHHRTHPTSEFTAGAVKGSVMDIHHTQDLHPLELGTDSTSTAQDLRGKPSPEVLTSLHAA